MSQQDPIRTEEENHESTAHTTYAQGNEGPDTKPNEEKLASTGLTANVAGLLCYLFWFVGGIVFLFIEKENRFVRFHAIQSIAVSVVYFVLMIVLDFIPFIGGILGALLPLAMFVLWIILMVKANKGEYFKLPVIGDFAENQLKNI